MTLAVLQPGYIPWLGFFDQMQRSDIFVLLDDVQFDKGGWRSRNRIKGPNGEPQWLTVPVKVHDFPVINKVEIDNSQKWARKHLGSLRQAYGKAPYFEKYFPMCEEILSQKWELLVDLDMRFITAMAESLGISTKWVLASEIDILGEKNQRLIDFCKRFSATTYLSGNAAQSYLDTSAFEKQGIEVLWQNYSHPTYPQPHGEFVPYLSALDLLFNVGDESASILAQSRLKN